MAKHFRMLHRRIKAAHVCLRVIPWLFIFLHHKLDQWQPWSATAVLEALQLQDQCHQSHCKTSLSHGSHCSSGAALSHRSNALAQKSFTLVSRATLTALSPLLPTRKSRLVDADNYVDPCMLLCLQATTLRLLFPPEYAHSRTRPW